MNAIEQRFPDQSGWWLLAVAVVQVIAVARLTRLWVYDAWPPVKWARERFLSWAEQTRPRRVALGNGQVHVPTRDLTWRAGWAPLATCPFCVAPWFALGSLVWVWWSRLQGPWGTAWWWLAVFLSVSYLASMLVVRDEPPEDD